MIINDIGKLMKEVFQVKADNEIVQFTSDNGINMVTFQMEKKRKYYITVCAFC